MAMKRNSPAGESVVRLVRPREEMPPEIAAALAQEALTELYDRRPAYQRNDYLRWIRQAKRKDTKERRLAQMIDELRRGNVFMRMPWSSGRT